MASSREKWSQLLTLALNGEPDVVPEGWFTRAQLKDHVGCGEATIGRKLRSLEKDGKVERKIFKIRDRANRLYAMPHWRIR